MNERAVTQIARGSYIAQAAPGGTATVVHYEFAPAPPVDPELLAKATDALQELPIDHVPHVSALPSGSRMPLGPNPLFTGRSHDLCAIAAGLTSDVPSSSVVVSGIPGAGKTQVATEFAHRYGRSFLGGVYWVSFSDPSTVASEIAACGDPGAMDLRPDFGTLTLEDRTRLVLAAWQSELPRLLVFDNCEEEALLAQWRPPTGGSRVLVTARRERWEPTLGVAVVSLDVLSRSDSVELLRRYRTDLSETDPSVLAIADELGRLPLALHLAGSYLSRYQQSITPDGYLAQLRESDLLLNRSLRDSRGFSPTGHEQDVARTFAVSYDRLDASAPVDHAAAELLAEAAHLAPGEVIPAELMMPDPFSAEPDSAETVHARLEAEDALARLFELGLVQSSAGRGLRLHRLLAAYVRAAADMPGAREQIADRVIDMVSRLEVEGSILEATGLETHLRALTDDALTRPPEELTQSLCNILGWHLRLTGDYEESVKYLQHGLLVGQALLGDEDPRLARELNDLGLSQLRAGNHVEAEANLQTALPRWEKLDDLPNYAATLDNLGQLAAIVGDDATAEEHFRKALDIRERYLGPEHERTAVTITNLGDLLMRRGDFTSALAVYSRAFQIRAKSKGQQHPDTALSLFNEAEAQRALGDFDGARRAFEQVVQVYSQALGDEHPQQHSLRVPRSQVC